MSATDLRILRALAHLGCATLTQLETLCCPPDDPASFPLVLNRLASAGLLHASRWSLADHGAIWTITASGLARLREQDTLPDLLAVPPLQPPHTPAQHELWQTRIDLRSVLVRLIVQARHEPLLSALRLLMLTTEPPSTASLVPPLPDAVLAIAWTPPCRQDAAWCPWGMPRHSAEHVVQYPVFVERPCGGLTLPALLDQWGPRPQSGIPLLIATTEEGCQAALVVLRERRSRQPLRVSHWAALVDAPAGAVWQDAHGQPCSLHPQPREFVVAQER